MNSYKLLAIALLASSLTFSTATMANNDDKGKHVAELKMIGNVENQPVFQLNLANTVEDEFTVTFRDEAGNVLYTDRFEGVNISKKYLLKSEEMGDASLNVIVRSKKANTTEVYVINRSASYVEETVVNKIK